ncbi:hypothetical protein WHEELER_1 [Mycobacterium phage Wheeler]|uniref:helicase n=1 Tax=Mycobacterium phage Wheeler TaxID=1383054 RepID=UPI000387F258|nr:helicase [Mycobacterium phage Wheeler]AGT13820.1 hypothetical protein WHEELER_1 [Mycobacterium phage Wheeler]
MSGMSPGRELMVYAHDHYCNTVHAAGPEPCPDPGRGESQQLTITDVIDELQRIRDEFGDLPVRTGGPEGDEVWSVWVTDLGPLSAVIG